MDLIETYLNNIQTINSMTLDDYDNKGNVKKNNKLATVNRQVAHHMLEVMNYSDEYRKMALDEIKDVINKNIWVESLGNKILLQQWYEQLCSAEKITDTSKMFFI
ncbi:MAG: hypothetical protein IJZ76_01930 [Lachnospiraceae bacterium]|nr:hypothetical protein [Lachnospiraceae bacterium]